MAIYAVMPRSVAHGENRPRPYADAGKKPSAAWSTVCRAVGIVGGAGVKAEERRAVLPHAPN